MDDRREVMEDKAGSVRARDNLFAAEKIERVRYKPQGATLDALLATLAQMDYCGAIVGPEGSGKTTLLEDIAAALEDRGRPVRMVFVNDTSPMTWKSSRELLTQIDARQVVLLDGADTISRMTWPALKRGIVRKAAGLIITAHKPGLMPTLIECQTTPVLFRQIVAEVVGSEKVVRPALLDEVYQRHNGNIREALRELYDLSADPATRQILTVDR